MATAVSSVISRVQALIQDATGVRWPEAELVDWINDAQREVVMLHPPAGAVTITHTLDDTDTKQSIPADGIQFLRAVRNVGGNAIRHVSRDILDAQVPNWHTESGTAVLHSIHDPVDPTVFYVYPKVTGSIDITVSKVPAVVTNVDNLALPDIYVNSIVDYVLYRAYSKDAESVANFNLAEAHRQRFAEGLGLKMQVDLTNETATGIERTAPIGA